MSKLFGHVSPNVTSYFFFWLHLLMQIMLFDDVEVKLFSSIITKLTFHTVSISTSINAPKHVLLRTENTF